MLYVQKENLILFMKSYSVACRRLYFLAQKVCKNRAWKNSAGRPYIIIRYQTT